MEIAPRIDVPALMHALKSRDDSVSYTAGRILGHHVCRHEEHREAIAAQQESVIAPLAAHLISQKLGLVQNATLVLGQCLHASTEFRQVFGQDKQAAEALVAAMQNQEAGVIVNATWAIRNFFSDAKCELSVELLDLVQDTLSPLFAHNDAHVQKHVSKLSTLVQQRREHLKATSPRRSEEEQAVSEQEQAVQALANIREERTRDEPMCIGALDVLAAITTAGDSDDDDESSPTIREHSRPLKSMSPTKTIKKHSPRRTESWKKAMAMKFSSGAKRKFHAAVNHAAAG